LILRPCETPQEDADGASEWPRASELAMQVSKSSASRRQRLSRAKVRSTTQRRGQQDRPLGSVGSFDNLNLQLPLPGHGITQFIAGVATIGEDVTQQGNSMRMDVSNRSTPCTGSRESPIAALSAAVGRVYLAPA
jgi:hypothetical protein